MATEDERYRQSTQYRFWSFSVPKLADLRAKTNALATAQISTRLRAANPGTETEPLPDFLTAAEEAQLLRFYTVELLRAAKFCELPSEIQATAAVFLRRFYITNSVMTYPPTDLLKTCLFFGSKAEGFYTRLSKFAEKFPNTTPEEVLAGEFLLCQGIRFAFDVKHPFRALEGTMLELRRRDDLEVSRIETARMKAREILKVSPLLTDAYFHYTPSQIMLAALSMVDSGLAEIVIDGAFTPGSGTADSELRSGAQVSEVRAKVVRTVETCRAMLETELPERMTEYWGTTESNKVVRPLLKKLKKCRDPDRADLVALQKARRELAQRKENNGAAGGGDELVFGTNAEARGIKRRKPNPSADDIFGPEL